MLAVKTGEHIRVARLRKSECAASSPRGGSADWRHTAHPPPHRQRQPTSSSSTASRAETSICTSTRSPHGESVRQAHRARPLRVSTGTGLFVSPAPDPLLESDGVHTLFVSNLAGGDTIPRRVTTRHKIDHQGRAPPSAGHGSLRRGRTGSSDAAAASSLRLEHTPAELRNCLVVSAGGHPIAGTRLAQRRAGCHGSALMTFESAAAALPTRANLRSLGWPFRRKRSSNELV